jgi:hypothetical protein
MGAAFAWFTTMVVLLGGILALEHLGVNIGPAIGAVVRGVVHWLGVPL